MFVEKLSVKNLNDFLRPIQFSVKSSLKTGNDKKGIYIQCTCGGVGININQQNISAKFYDFSADLDWLGNSWREFMFNKFGEKWLEAYQSHNEFII